MNNGCHWPPPHKLKLKHERNFTKVQLLLGFSGFCCCCYFDYFILMQFIRSIFVITDLMFE